MINIIQNLLNGSSKLMNIDGSSTPKTFTYSPGGGEYAEIRGLYILLKDDGSTTFDKFGAITALTNGLLIKCNTDSVDSTITLIKDNADLCTRFDRSHFGSSAVLSILSIVTPEGFGGSTDVFVGYLQFDDPIVLFDTDSISAVVQDNLSAVDFLQMSCKIVTGQP